MFFAKTLEELGNYVPNNNLANSEVLKDWETFSYDMTGYFYTDFNEFMDIVLKDIKLKPLKNIEIEPIFFAEKNKHQHISLITLKFNSNYDFNMALNVALLFRSINIQLSIPSITFYLCFNGEKEGAAFKEMYLNYKRIIEILLRKLDRHLNFYYTIEEPFSSKTQGKSVYYNLNKCFLENYAYTPTDIELIYPCYHARDEDIVDAFKVFIALLDCCYNYSTDRKDKDKILRYYHEIIK